MKQLKDFGPNQALSFAEQYNPAVKQWGTGKKFEEKNRKRMMGVK